MIIIYKLNGNNLLFDVLGTVAENRGIKELGKIMEFSYEDITSPYLLKNMKQAVELFDRHQRNGKESKVTVLVDSDP